MSKSLFNPITGEEFLVEKRRYEPSDKRSQVDDTWSRRNLYDDRFLARNMGSAESKRMQKELERGQKRGAARGIAPGAGVGAAGGAVVGARVAQRGQRGRGGLIGAGVGAGIGGLYGAAIGGQVGLQRSRTRHIQTLEREGKVPKAVRKSVSPMFGARDAFADQPTQRVGMLVPTGSHVSHANDLERYTGLKQSYRRQPVGRGAQRLLHVKGKGRDRAAREFRGEVTVASKGLMQVLRGKPKGPKMMGGGQATPSGGRLATNFGPRAQPPLPAPGSAKMKRWGPNGVEKADTTMRLGFNDVERAGTFGRQAGRRGARFA